jgi:DNA-binding transcriptional LysR family regulator
MDIRQMQYFIEICRQRSFAKAAERLYISQQGLSMAISRLEEELSSKLFWRSGKELRLSEQGEFLLPHAEEIISQFQICEDYFQELKQAKQQQRTVSIASAFGAMPEFAGRLVFQFQQEYPEIWLSVHEYTDTACDEGVWNGDAELGFTPTPLDSKKFESEKLLVRRGCLLVHSSHPLASREPVPLDILRTTPIMMMDETSKAQQIVMACCRQFGFQPKLQFQAGEIIAVHRLVSANRGVGLSVESVARTCPIPTSAIPFDDPRMVWEVHLIKKRDAVLSQVAKTFERYVIGRWAAVRLGGIL